MLKVNTYFLHGFLLIVTFLTVTFREYIFSIPVLEINEIQAIFFREINYSIPLILILFAHEMGHYIPSRFYGIRATLPYFIPMPLGPIGTMGAVIRIQEPITDKKKLFDIGIGGPLMSLLLSIPYWIIGIYLSELHPIDPIKSKMNLLYFGDSLFTHYTSQWILGPFDTSKFSIHAHGFAQAGWVGLIITAINLLPFGQLDGGHVIYSVFGERYRKWIYYLFLGFLFFSLINMSWLIWGFLIYFLIKIEHPYVPEPPTPMNRSRKVLGILMLISLIFIFVPVPMTTAIDMDNNTLFEDIIDLFKIQTK